jgi:hypothetical protein
MSSWCGLSCWRLGGGARLRAIGWLRLLTGVGGCLVELLGEPLVLGSGGVEVGFGLGYE